MKHRLLSKALCVFAAAAVARGQAAEDTAETTRPAEPAALQLQVLKSWKMDLGNRAIYLNRVVPPVLPEPPAPPPPPTADEIAAAEAAELRTRPQKRQEVLFLSATVYDRKVTEVRWFDAGSQFRAFSNIDFNYFSGVGEIQTPDADYWLILGLGNETSEEVEGFNQYAAEQGWPKEYWKQIPPWETFSPTRSEYLLKKGNAKDEATEPQLAALDALHRYFDANKERLVDEYTRRVAANDERQRWLKEHPPVPKDTVINFWLEPSKPKSAGEGRAK